MCYIGDVVDDVVVVGFFDEDVVLLLVGLFVVGCFGNFGDLDCGVGWIVFMVVLDK